jgi:O-succinylbenzoic acid--CoA ligase
MVVARSVIAGTEPVAVDLTKGFDPDVFSAASDRLFAVTGRHYTAMVPRQLADVLRAAGRPLAMLARYDAVLVGGAATDAALLHSARRAGVTVVVSYGMTETCGGCVYDGVPLTGAKIAVTNDHRLQVAGPMLAHGYRLRPDLADAFAGGWFTTSDVGHIECDGTLVINGRIDDVAISGGVKVPLVDVDVAVSSHPMVAEALSVGVADDRWGQRIVVAVVPTEPARPPLLQSIRAHVREKYPVAYAPQELHVLSELPLLPSGKPDRHGLADQLDRTALGPAD